MNKAILAGVAVIATAASVCAQGTLQLSTASGTKPRITLDGVNATADDHIFVQVLVAGATSLTGTDTFQLKLGGNNAGLFSSGIIGVTGQAGGNKVDVTIRAWDSDTGLTYDLATVKATTTITGFTLGGAGDPPGPPSPIAVAGGFSGLNLISLPAVPEPSTYALAALGLGGLLFLRRK